MSPPGRRCPRLAWLVTVLWAAGLSRAGQSPPSAAVGAGLDSEQLLRLIVHDVTAKVEPLVGKLAARIDRLDSRLIGFDARLSRIETRLDQVQFKQDSFGGRLDNLVFNADSTDSRLDNLVSRANSTDGKLDDLFASINSTNSRLEDLVSREDSTNSRLNDLASRADSTDSRLDDFASRTDSTDSRLDELASGVDGPAAGQSGTLANQTKPRDCSQLPAGAETGIHMLQPGLDPSQPPVAAYCDMDTDGGGWTVFQRRKDTILPRQSFDLGWSDYRSGFGELDKEFWWGLENLWRMTGQGDRQYELRVDLVDLIGERWYAVYRRLRVASEADGYRLSVSHYSGNAGDGLSYHNDQRFSTRDRDQDGDRAWNCAEVWRGGWWHNSCAHAHLNGRHWAEINDGPPNGNYWESQNEDEHWLKLVLAQSVMRIRPVSADQ